MITIKDIIATVFFGSYLYGLFYLLDYGAKSVGFGSGPTWIAPTGIFGCLMFLLLLSKYLKYRSSHKTSHTSTAQNDTNITKTPDLHVKSTAQNE